MIGSGATAVTLVPALAAQGAQVTMLQRSPSYIAAVPSIDPTAERLQRRWPARVTYPLVRWKYVLIEHGDLPAEPTTARADEGAAAAGSRARLPAGFDVDTHLTPTYDPWDQRLCVDARRRPVPGHPVRRRRHRHRPHRPVHPGRRAAQLRAPAGRRRHRHRHGSGPAGLGGMELRVDGREVDPGGNRGLQGHDAVRRAELRSDRRLHQRLVDAQGGSGRALRVPAAAVPRSRRLPQRHADRPRTWPRSS